VDNFFESYPQAYSQMWVKSGNKSPNTVDYSWITGAFGDENVDNFKASQQLWITYLLFHKNTISYPQVGIVLQACPQCSEKSYPHYPQAL
jgi:hypothetical protein